MLDVVTAQRYALVAGSSAGVLSLAALITAYVSIGDYWWHVQNKTIHSSYYVEFIYDCDASGSCKTTDTDSGLPSCMESFFFTLRGLTFTAFSCYVVACILSSMGAIVLAIRKVHIPFRLFCVSLFACVSGSIMSLASYLFFVKTWLPDTFCACSGHVLKATVCSSSGSLELNGSQTGTSAAWAVGAGYKAQIGAGFLGAATLIAITASLILSRQFDEVFSLSSLKSRKATGSSSAQSREKTLANAIRSLSQPFGFAQPPPPRRPSKFASSTTDIGRPFDDVKMVSD